MFINALFEIMLVSVQPHSQQSAFSKSSFCIHNDSDAMCHFYIFFGTFLMDNEKYESQMKTYKYLI